MRKIAIILLLLGAFYSCKQDSSTSLNVKTILRGVKINTISYQYSNCEESVCISNSDTISLRNKAEYNTQGMLTIFTIFKSEGALQYSRDDVLNDTALLCNTHIELENKWRFICDTVITNEKDTLIVKAVAENAVKSRINNQVIIFEFNE